LDKKNEKIYQEYQFFFKLLGESFSFAYDSVMGDKFRAFLSLLGVTIGIFSIVAVFTVYTCLEKNVRNMFSSLGTDVVYIDKISWEAAASGAEGFKWWEFRERPNNTYEEFLFLQANCTLADKIALSAVTTAKIKQGRNTISGGRVYGITYYWNQISSFDIEKVVILRHTKLLTIAAMAIIGQNVADDFSRNRGH
jgi:putative ABC transport system permease protein